ncbi:hypothetical protein [Cohnella algarum]
MPTNLIAGVPDLVNGKEAAYAGLGRSAFMLCASRTYGSARRSWS